MIIYYTKEGKFETDDWKFSSGNVILHSPNEMVPAYFNTENNFKSWWFNGKRHRLNGPAIIDHNNHKQFWLNGVRYEFENWLKIHPNQEVSFQTKMRLQYT